MKDAYECGGNGRRDSSEFMEPFFNRNRNQGGKMKTWTARRFSWAVSGVFAACLAFAAHGSTNVFNDAVFWFRGGRDLNGDGYMRQQGEFFDDLHADDPTHGNHKMDVLTYSSPALADEFKSNAVFHEENVVFPALGDQILKSIPVLRLSNKAVVYSNKNYYWPQFVKSKGVFNDIASEYTIISRLRLDDDGRSRTQCVFKVGYDASNGQGMWLGFSEMDKTTKTKYITGRCTPNSNGVDSPFSFEDFQILTNTWFDMAVVVGNGKLRVGLAVPNSYQDNPTVYFAETNMVTSSRSLLEDSYRLFCEIGQSAQETSLAKIDQTCFIGSVQQLAIWGRRLEDQEVMEAFGMPRPALLRIGLDNDVSNEFGGTRTNTTQTIDGLGSWQNIANTMKVGDTWTVKFNALRDDAGLAQILSVKSLPGSATAKLEPRLNNHSLGERRIAKNGRAFWPVPKGRVFAGENTLVIVCKDAGLSGFLMDAMELGGSFGVGNDDESINDGRTAPKRTATSIPSAANPNVQHWPQGLQPYAGITNLHIRVWVDPDVTNKASFVFRAATQCANRSSTQTIAGSEYFSIFINGVYNGRRRTETEWQKHKLEFAPGDLKGGWNDFEFIAPMLYPTCHWSFDYYCFETVLPSAFSSPEPPGLSIFIR